jgi:hypothetical protein
VQLNGECGAIENPEAEGRHCSLRNPQNVFDCLMAQNMADIAYREAGLRFGNRGGRMGGPLPYPAGGDRAQYGPPDGSMGNAFQHMVWNGLMVAKLDNAAAKGFADRHEMTTLSGDPQLRNWELHLRGMDFANNWYGREIAQQVLAMSSEDDFERRFFDEAERFVRSGKACWIANHSADRATQQPRFSGNGARCGVG